MKKSTSFFNVLLSFLFSVSILFSNAQPSSWQTRGAGGGGSMFYPAINPANDNEFYVACDMSQLFHSTDFGLSYTQVPFTKLQVGNISTYEFTNNNNIAYCIANDGNINYPVRTINGGASWAAVPGNPLIGDDLFGMKADYSNPGRVVLDYYDAIYISNDTGKTFSPAWSTASGSGLTIAGILFDGSNIYIGTNEGVLYSANGGSSFSKLVTTGIPVGQVIFSFAGAKVGTTTRFFCITANAGDVYNGIFPWEYGFTTGVYSMDAGTNTWAPKMTGINISTDYIMYAGMARNDINTVYLGGSDDGTGGNLVMKTSNAGAGWNKVFVTANNQNIRTGWSGQGGDRGWGFGESCFGISVAPNNANKVLFGDFGFVHKTSDGGTSWQQAYVNTADDHPAASPTPPKQYYHSIGLENTTVWQVHWQDANNMFGCYSDINGIRSTDAGITWGFDYTGHNVNSMYRIAKHISNSTMFAATSGVHDMYQSTRLQDGILDANDNGGKIIYSTSNGASWQLLHQFNHPVFWLATDPNNANRMYASVIQYGGAAQGGIWTTADLNNLGTSAWTKLNNPPRTEGHPATIIVLNDGKVVCTYSGRRNAGGAFTGSSGVFIYDPVAVSWTDVSHSGMQYWTKDIVIDPSDPTQSTWYACVFSGWGGAPNGLGGLYKTINRGGAWTKLTGSQFDRVTSITFNPTLPTQAYLTTEVQGLWMSNNMNVTTPTWTQVTSYPFRQPERVFFNPYNLNEIWVSSFGNGLKLGLSTPIPVKLISFSGNRDNDRTQLKWVTANEDRGDRFEIERSSDGSNYEKIGTVAGNGNSNNQYSFNDVIVSPVLYYRIKIVSASGNVFYSNIIVFRKNGPVNFVRLINNPVKDNIVLQAGLQIAGTLEYSLTDISGKQVMQDKIAVNAGSSQFSIPLPLNCTGGTYILKLQGQQVQRSIRVLVLN